MTSVFSSRRLALLAALAASVLLASCKVGGSGSSNASLRAINLSDDLASVDLYVDGTQQFGALTKGTVNAYTSVSADTHTVSVNSAGNSTTLFTGTYTFSKNDHYTAVIWGPQAALHVSTLPEDDDTTQIGKGNTRVRMFNATTTTGTLDVYLQPAGTDLTQATPTQGTLTSGTLAGFKEIAQNAAYTLTVTGAGNPNDIRLVVPGISLTAQQYTTFVITAGSGGVLVNASMLVEQGSASSYPNQQARVRLVASVDGAGQVTATVSGNKLANNLQSPGIGQYVLVPAGSDAVTTNVNGNILTQGPQTFNAGADYTLMVWGSAAANAAKPLTVTTITDLNQLPTSTTRSNVRLINGAGMMDALTMSVDYLALTSSSNILPGSAAAYQQVTSDTQAYIEVDSPINGTVYASTRTNGDNLAAQGVYTMFVLGGLAPTTANPTGAKAVLRSER
ncbi:MAG: DUF4397 domain-containing protein [Burkholderiales bacterium]|nr:DUF4397 domain-containing protein [Burkholderiales bacterium]